MKKFGISVAAALLAWALMWIGGIVYAKDYIPVPQMLTYDIEIGADITQCAIAGTSPTNIPEFTVYHVVCPAGQQPKGEFVVPASPEVTSPIIS